MGSVAIYLEQKISPSHRIHPTPKFNNKAKYVNSEPGRHRFNFISSKFKVLSCCVPAKLRLSLFMSLLLCHYCCVYCAYR